MTDGLNFILALGALLPRALKAMMIMMRTTVIAIRQ